VKFVVFSDNYESFCNDGYRHFGQDFCEDNDEETEKDGDVMEFDRIALKMVNLTPDGGVKKQILSQGVGEVVPDKAYVTGECCRM